ncbi:MAG: hypothetical protein JO024_06890 [Candidatus Eremiobacteraeota bacterium]|nr:hypothetical protein [Candidatus Eremiobacteraeota bacterium]
MSDGPKAFGMLFCGAAIGFVLGALAGPAIKKSTAQWSTSPPQRPGSTPFSGPTVAEGGGYDGEPVSNA